MLLLLIFLFLLAGKSKDTDIYSVETFTSGNGWGYQIYMNGQLIIYQPNIPCVIGDEPFPDAESAIAVARIVVDNIKKTGDPSITIEDIHGIINIYD